MYYITKTLEEAFTKITYGAAKYMMNIPKYKAELKNDLKRIIKGCTCIFNSV